jgi:hypothetical protein
VWSIWSLLEAVAVKMLVVVRVVWRQDSVG